MRIGGSLDNAIEEWEREVEAEAVKLIRRGVSPWDAIKQAREIIAGRRQDKYRREGAHE